MRLLRIETLLFLLFPIAINSAEDWTLLWSEEFNYDGAPDSSVWTPLLGDPHFNGEVQTYTDDPQNLYVQDGKLRISVVKPEGWGYSSARIDTHGKVQTKFAMLEASIKIPDIIMGLWPAFWTLGETYPDVGWPACGEIDIAEIGLKYAVDKGLGNKRVVSAWHWQDFNEYMLRDAHIDMPYDLNGSFHTYNVVWQPTFISTYVDDQMVGTMSLEQCSTELDCPELQQYHFLILNMAVGGDFTCCDFGLALDNYQSGTAWTMEVDYVRIYGNEHTELVAPPIKAEEEPGTTTTDKTPIPSPRPTNARPVSTNSPILPPTSEAPTEVTQTPSLRPSSAPFDSAQQTPTSMPSLQPSTDVDVDMSFGNYSTSNLTDDDEGAEKEATTYPNALVSENVTSTATSFYTWTHARLLVIILLLSPLLQTYEL